MGPLDLTEGAHGPPKAPEPTSQLCLSCIASVEKLGPWGGGSWPMGRERMWLWAPRAASWHIHVLSLLDHGGMFVVHAATAR